MDWENMSKQLKLRAKKSRKYWLTTERYPRFVLPLLFSVFVVTGLGTTFAVLPLLEGAAESREKLVFEDTDDDSSLLSSHSTADENSETPAEKSAENDHGTSETTEQDTETPAETETATNPTVSRGTYGAYSAYSTSANSTKSATSASSATASNTTNTTSTSNTTTSDSNKITVDQNQANTTPTIIVNPTPDDDPTDITDLTGEGSE